MNSEYRPIFGQAYMGGRWENAVSDGVGMVADL
jgi:hypothetical protein